MFPVTKITPRSSAAGMESVCVASVCARATTVENSVIAMTVAVLDMTTNSVGVSNSKPASHHTKQIICIIEDIENILY